MGGSFGPPARREFIMATSNLVEDNESDAEEVTSQC